MNVPSLKNTFYLQLEDTLLYLVYPPSWLVQRVYSGAEDDGN